MKTAFFRLHIAVILAGFTGVLGRLITLNEAVLVFYRLLLSALALWLIAAFRKTKKDAANATSLIRDCICKALSAQKRDLAHEVRHRHGSTPVADVANDLAAVLVLHVVVPEIIQRDSSRG